MVHYDATIKIILSYDLIKNFNLYLENDYFSIEFHNGLFKILF